MTASVPARQHALPTGELAHDDVPGHDDVVELHRRYVADRSPALRAELVERHAGLARALAHRMAGTSREREDIVQVALLGLLHAVDRFEPDRGVTFTTYAWATIVGEIKKHHRRDQWGMHVSRQLQEAYIRASVAVDDLTQDLGRSPTVSEIARRSGAAEETVIAALDVGQAYGLASIDAPLDGSGEGRGIEVADDRDAMEELDQRDELRLMLSRLPVREREVVRLRFVDEMSQAQIAARIGVSQMQVSRLLAQSLARLRALAREPH
ncbi:MAG TPA: sigma-70 family RNA polymerase sigma factor [Acidimicrobiales bacterium]